MPLPPPPQTAIPTFLIDFFKTRPLDVSSLEVSDSDMNAFEPEKIKPVVLLYQTGYLTIKGFEQNTDKFRLAGKPITLIGLAFSTKKRAVSGAKIVRDA